MRFKCEIKKTENSSKNKFGPYCFIALLHWLILEELKDLNIQQFVLKT